MMLTVNPAWVKNKRAVGINAGASAPDILVRGVIARLQALGAEAPGRSS